jgi:hypothetical protein
LEDDDLDAMNDDTFGDDTVPGDGSLADLAAMTQQREWHAASRREERRPGKACP